MPSKYRARAGRQRKAGGACRVHAGGTLGLLWLATLLVAFAYEPARAEGVENGGDKALPHDGIDLGTPYVGFSVADPPAGVSEPRRDSASEGIGRWFFQSWSAKPAPQVSAETLYTSAMDALRDNRRDEAQRLLERLISEAPESPRASAARQQLGRIYRGVDGEARAVSVGRTDGHRLPSSSQSGVPAPAKPALAGLSQPLSQGSLHQARVSPAIDAQFLSDAGDRVFFGTGSAVLGARAWGVIQAQARFLIRYPNLFAAVEGHADDGALPDAETLRLSEQRAAVVRDRLIAEGVDARRLVAYGRGRDDRVSDCAASECMAQNRRAVTVLLNRRVAAKPMRRAQGEASAGSTDVSPTQ